MELIYQLNSATSRSDRKYKYSKILEYLEKAEIDSLKLSDSSLDLYSHYREKVKTLNKEMFKFKADHQAIISALDAIEDEVIRKKDVSPFLKQYITSHILPKTAYCYYKLKDYSRAETILNRQFLLGTELFNKGLYFQVFDSLEQMLNLSKVLVAQNRLNECVHNWSELFKFLVNGSPSDLSCLQFDYASIDNGLNKIVKEYTILNFLNTYISDHMKFGVYPNPSVLFSPWYNTMEVDTSERLAIYRYIYLQESVNKTPLDKFIGEVVEFTQLFENKNYLVLRCSLIALLVEKVETGSQSVKQRSDQAIFLRNYLNSLNSGIVWVNVLSTRLEKLIIL